MFDSLSGKLRGLIEAIAPSPETLARREALSVQEACCGLLMEVAWIDSAAIEQKHKAVTQAMQEQFGIPDDELATMIANARQPENRLTSYYRPVSLINRRYQPEQKAQFIEQLWRVAMAGGTIDMYEEHLVRKLADLLYVAHTDFILAKHRVQGGGETPAK